MDRQGQSRVVRRLLINAYKSKQDSESAMSALTSQTSHYEKHMERLDKFRQDSKVTTKQVSALSIWEDERLFLQRQSNRFEKEIHSHLQQFLIAEPGFSSEVVNIIGSNQKVLKELTLLMRTQIEEVKDILHHIIKTRGEDVKVFKNKAATFSQLLLHAKEQLRNQTKELADVEKQLSKDVYSSQSQIRNLVAFEKREQQDQELSRVFTLGVNEPIEVQDVIQRLRNELNDMDTQFSKNFMVIEDSLSLLKGKSSSEKEPPSGLVDLTEEQFKTFKKIYDFSIAKGLPRSSLLQTLELNLPKVAKAELHLCERRYRLFKAYLLKKSLLMAANDTARETFVESANQEVKEMRLFVLEESNKQAAIAEHESYRRALSEKLAALEDSRENAMLALESSAARERLMEMERLVDEKRTQDVLRARTKEKVLRHKQQLLEERRKRDEEEEAKLDDLRDKLRQLIEENRPHVERRSSLLAAKAEARKQADISAAKVAEERRAALEKLVEQVPYYENLQNAKSNLDHITASVKAHEYVKMEEKTRGFIPTFGLVDEKVIRDVRFKLGVALREAGLHHTSAAKDLVQRMHPRPELAIHGIL